MALKQELQERVARRAVHLMPQPQTALRLQRLVANPNHTLAQVVDAVKVDPLLAAAVMRIANSASAWRGRPTTSLASAVTRIGEHDLSRLALASGLGAATTAAGPLQGLRRRAMQDSLASALICERLAPEFDLDPESLFLEGLLHDVGGLIALATLELIVAQQPKTPPMDAEAWIALAQAHHVELGSLLSEKWQLPVAVRTVIATHHEADGGAHDAATVVRWSDGLLELVHAGAPLEERALPWLIHVAAERRAALLESLAAVPALVAAFEDERGPSEGSPLVSSPRPPPTSAEGLWFTARMTGGRTGEATLRSPRHLLLRGRQRVPDHHLAELELDLDGELLKLWVRFTFSGLVGLDGLALAEAIPFAPTREIAARLEALWSALQVVEVAA